MDEQSLNTNEHAGDEPEGGPEREHGTETSSSRAELAADRTDWARERTLLAKQRTFAAWLRTGMASVVVGFAARASSAGAAILVLGYRGYRGAFRKLEREGVKSLSPSVHAGVTGAIFVATLLLLFRDREGVSGRIEREAFSA